MVLHDNPCVLYCKVPWVDYFSHALRTPKPVAILVSTNWKLNRQERANAIQWAKDHLHRHPSHYIEFLLDRDEEVEVFTHFDLNVTRFNPNALCDERVYRLLLDVERKYPAVYVARPAFHKKLPLCREIKGKWLWITYNVDENPRIVAETLAMRNCHAPQFTDGKYTHYINRSKIPEYLNSASVGLCLSDEEGSMYTSAEYLLCGLPVVATPGLGTSRADLFTPQTAFITKANAFSIREAVLEVGKLSDPEMIRKQTLGKMQPYRCVFVDALRRAYQAVGITHDPAFDLPHLWRHQMTFWQPVNGVLSGGNQENRELLSVAQQEPHLRKMWCDTAGRFWENPCPMLECGATT